METTLVKKKYEYKLLGMRNVIGVMTAYKTRGGERTDTLSITCLVEQKIEASRLEPRDLIPKTLDDQPTDVVEVGRIRALAFDPKKKHRPSPMGTSGGHYMITAGTNGELLRDNLTGGLCIGTNNHVGANSNEARIGDPYLQPGPFDGGKNPQDMMGRLLRFVPIRFIGEPSQCPVGGLWSWLYNIPARLFGVRTRLKPVVMNDISNRVDAALIEVLNPEDVLPEISGIGVPKGKRLTGIDVMAQKSGRTTGHTRNGPVSSIDATVNVDYGPGRTATFTDQIIIAKPGFSAGGDSGSLILDMEGYALGKLFAGSDTITIANHIDEYLQDLQADLITNP